MAKYNAAEIQALGEKGKAFKNADGHYSFPIADEQDLVNALQSVGMSNDDHDNVREFIIGRAHDLGLSHLIPAGWNNDGTLKGGRSANKPRMSAAARKDRSRKEARAAYREQREDRVFAPRLTSSAPVARGAATVAGDANCIILTGQPTVYGVSYNVNDAYGTFQETVAPGALTACLKTCDARLLFDHRGLPLARVSAGTLTLVDTKQALTMTARLDPRIDKANALALAIERRDVQEMSVGFRVGADTWNADMTIRVINRIDELHDVSAVSFPASPTTSIELLEQDLPDVDAGQTGDQGGNQGGSVPDSMDGTGSRSRRSIEVDLALASGPERLPARSARPPRGSAAPTEPPFSSVSPAARRAPRFTPWSGAASRVPGWSFSSGHRPTGAPGPCHSHLPRKRFNPMPTNTPIPTVSTGGVIAAATQNDMAVLNTCVGLFGAGSPISGSLPSQNAPNFQLQFFRQLATCAAGAFTISWPATFPNGVLFYSFQPEDAGAVQSTVQLTGVASTSSGAGTFWRPVGTGYTGTVTMNCVVVGF